LYTEKILEYYQRSSYLNLSPSDSKFIAFVALIYKADDETIRKIAQDYNVELNDDRISIIKLVQDKHKQFEDIVNIVSKDIKKYG
jgi:sulfur relay (sulfurtransferase) DsrC/TusE family protein